MSSGLLTATAAVATMGEARTFRSGRQFAAFLGLVPRQTGTGGRVQLHGISKRGDRYVRTLLIHGARSVLSHRRAYAGPNTWLGRLVQRRHTNVAAVALAATDVSLSQRLGKNRASWAWQWAAQRIG